MQHKQLMHEMDITTNYHDEETYEYQDQLEDAPQPASSSRAEPTGVDEQRQPCKHDMPKHCWSHGSEELRGKCNADKQCAGSGYT